MKKRFVYKLGSDWKDGNGDLSEVERNVQRPFGMERCLSMLEDLESR